MENLVPTSSASLYTREVLPQGLDSLSRIARLIRPGSRVLDLGAYTGALGKYLKENLACLVDGVELDQDAATLARPFYGTLLVADLESLVLNEHFSAAHYDYVVCADVLEHLRDPGRIVEDARHLLTDGGCLLISIPNVSYAGVVAGLLQGEFRYRPTGVLDSTHLRFFTRASLTRFLAEHDFGISHIEAVTEELRHSEFRQTYLECLPPPLFRAVLSNPDALTYQFIVAAVSGKASSLPDNAPLPEPVMHFSCQLFWKGPGEAFREENSLISSAIIGMERQTVKFVIPPLEAQPDTLRLDLADRPGYLRLHEIRLDDANGNTLWAWSGNMASLAEMSCHDVAFSTDSPNHVLLTGEDPHIELNIPASRLAALAQGGCLFLEMGWPLSADFLAASKKIALIEKQGIAEAEQFRAEINTLLSSQAEDRQLLVRKDGELVRKDGELARKDGELALLKHEINALNSALAALTATNQRLSSELSGMLASASWRLTDPLRRGRAFLRRAYRFIIWRTHHMRMVPAHDLLLQDGLYHSTGADPYFKLESDRAFLPCGWCRISYAAHSDGKPLTPVLYLDVGEGFSEQHRLPLPVSTNGGATLLAKLPPFVRALRLDPTDSPAAFSFKALSITEVGKAEAASMLAWPFLRRALYNPAHFFSLLGKTLTLLRTSGLSAFKHKLLTKNQATDYQTWVALYDTLTDQDRAAIRRHIDTLAFQPLISVIMPTYNTPEKWLRLAIESVTRQLYPNWELCIADDASSAPHVRKVLEEYQGQDSRIKIVFRKQNGHISVASNSALELASGEFAALLDHDDELAEHALYFVALAINDNPQADLIYSDEDKIDIAGNRSDAYFKPDWDPFLLEGQNYISHLGTYRLARLHGLGGFRVGVEGSQDWDLVLRFTEGLPEENIVHIPKILYHWRILPGSTALAEGEKSYAKTSAKLALEEHFLRMGVKAEVLPNCGGYWHVRRELPQPVPLISLIIPTRNQVELLRMCITSIVEKTAYPNYEIIVVDNQSDDSETLSYLRELSSRPFISVLEFDGAFNFSAINNYAVRHAKGSLIGLINNDIEVIDPQWLNEMAGYALFPQVGAVGAMLYYPNNTIQHAGVIIGLGGVANHACLGKPRGYPGYFGRATLTQTFSAVTAACLLVRKHCFDEVMGLNEDNLAVAFNDIDFCLRLNRRGYRNLWIPFAELYHHESASRGKNEDPQKSSRFMNEINYMMKNWEQPISSDPAYNPNLSLEGEDFRLAFPPRIHQPWKIL